ncbi:hypothetical protein DPMN_159024 [Dreissena polymorpha]|uniref:Uncharacterized protein n=1 Tax=Dreissena polymorpha TaxID=45954 RepID=A0A9D4EKX2_DREPO|nr:hypothetical protein DPMN_159024 [Dreissena polymorpha]
MRFFILKGATDEKSKYVHELVENIERDEDVREIFAILEIQTVLMTLIVSTEQKQLL